MRTRNTHSKRVISALVVLSMLVSLMSGLSFSTVSAAESVSVDTWSELKTALEKTGDVNITVAGEIDFAATDAATAIANCITVSSGNKTLELNGFGVNFEVSEFELMEVSGVPKSLITVSNSASLTVKDAIGSGLINYLASSADYLTFDAPKQSGGLISVSGNATVNVVDAALNNVAIGPCINVTGGSPKVTLDGALLTAGSALYGWSGGFTLFINEAAASPSVKILNGTEMSCSSNSIYSEFASGAGALYVGNLTSSIEIAHAVLYGAVQIRVADQNATKLPFVSVSTHQIKVDKTVHTADANYLTGPINYEDSADTSGAGAGHYYMIIADVSTGNYQTIKTEITQLSDVEDQSNVYPTVREAFENAYGTTQSGFRYDFSTDTAGVNLVSGSTYFKDKITPSVGSDESSISVLSGLTAKMTGFSQFASDNRWTGASEMSFDLKMASDGNNFAGFNIKYGKELISGESLNSVFYNGCSTGISFSFATVDGTKCIKIAIKYLDSNGNTRENITYCYDVVSDLTAFNTYRVSDDAAGTIKFYANDILFATVACSDAKVPTATTVYTEQYYSTVKVMDKKGKTVATISNALVSTESAIAFATANETIEFDNIEILDKKNTDPKINGAYVLIENDLSIVYYVRKTDIDSAGFTNLKLIAYTDDGEPTVLEKPEVANVGGTDRYTFTFKNINPKMMNDNIYTTLYAKLDGKVYASKPVQYSIANYAYSMLSASTTPDVLKTLLVDMLIYGSKAQVFTGHNTENLVDANLTADMLSYATKELRPLVNSLLVPSYSDDNVDEIPPVLWRSAGLTLTNTVELSFSFAAENAEGYIVKITDDKGNLLKEINSNYFTNTKSSTGENRYVFGYAGLLANQLSTPINLTVYNSVDSVVSGTLVYSVESYAYTQQNSSNTALADLVKAMMIYGDSVRAYTA